MTTRRPPSAVPGPGVRSLSTLGPQLLRDDPVEVAVTLRERYGDLVRIPPIYPGIDGPVYLAVNPDDVQSVLQTDPNDYRGLDIPGSSDFAAAVEGSILGAPEGGPDWWIERLRTISPEFDADRVSRRAPALARETATTLAEYAPPSTTGSADGAAATDPAVVADGRPGVRLHPLASRLSLRLLGQTLFGPDVRAHETDVVRAVARLRGAFKQRTFGVVTGALTRRFPDDLTDRLERLRRVRDPDWLDRDTRPLDALHGAARAMVGRRERLPGSFDDAIATWLTRPDPVTGNVLDRTAVEAEVAGLLIAGFATVSAALTWAVVLLAEHPETADRLAAEARDSRLLASQDGLDGLDDSDSWGDSGAWGFDALAADLPGALRVWRETLRLYPTLPVFGRTSRRPVELSGYRLPADTTVLVSPYVTQRDPAHWPQPTRFDPDRFAPERAADRHEFAYYPFSAGPHGCLGRYVATVEGVAALATLCSEYRVELVEGTEPTGIDSAINIEPDGDPRVRLRPRDAGVS